MRPAHRDIVITGLGAVCAVAGNCADLWAAVAEGRGGIAPIRRFRTDGFTTCMGALVQAWAESRPGEAAATEVLCRRFAEAAGREALLGARLDAWPGRTRMGLVFGTGLGGLEHPIHSLGEELADTLGLLGPRLTVSTACSSSTGAIGLARDLIAMEAADIVVAGGADVLSPEVFAGFHALGVLSPTKCAPFSLPVGTTLGEGAGFVVLERGDAARSRGAEVIAKLSGYGLSGDGWHETSPDPKGAGVERAIRGALRDAALPATEIGYVNVHGSGTEVNDPAEWLGIQRGLGPHARAIPLSSTKGALGHAQGAAGALEAIVTILAMRRGVVPPTLNFTAPRPHSPADPVPGPTPRAAAYRHALSLNSAFGGANAAVVLSQPDGASAPRERKGVSVLGVGLVGPFGLGADAYLAGRAGGAGRRVAPFALERLVPTADTRGLDPTSRFLTAAAALALDEAGVRPRGPLRDRAGLLVGQVRASPASLTAFRRSIEERGLPLLSATAFARIVLNAAAGACSKLLALRGPLTALTAGAGSGLAALVLAAELLSTRDEVEMIVAAGADELMPDGVADGPACDAEGAVCLLLANEAGAGRARAGAAVRVTGWGLAGPGRLPEAVERAAAGESGGGVPELVFRAEDPERAGRAGEAAGSVLAAAAAVLALRGGEADRVLVASDAGRSISAALVLAR